MIWFTKALTHYIFDLVIAFEQIGLISDCFTFGYVSFGSISDKKPVSFGLQLIDIKIQILNYN